MKLLKYVLTRIIKNQKRKVKCYTKQIGVLLRKQRKAKEKLLSLKNILKEIE